MAHVRHPRPFFFPGVVPDRRVERSRLDRNFVRMGSRAGGVGCWTGDGRCLLLAAGLDETSRVATGYRHLCLNLLLAACRYWRVPHLYIPNSTVQSVVVVVVVPRTNVCGPWDVPGREGGATCEIYDFIQ